MNKKPIYFDTLKKDHLYLLTPKLGPSTGYKNLIAPSYFPENVLEEVLSGSDIYEKKYPTLRDKYLWLQEELTKEKDPKFLTSLDPDDKEKRTNEIQKIIKEAFEANDEPA